MTILFLSDIHGLPQPLQTIWNYADSLNPDLIVLLGDLLYHGPRNGVPQGYDPVAVANLLNARKHQLLAVRGNCDSEVDQMMLEFPILSDFSELHLPDLRFFLTHGHRWNATQLPPCAPGTILTHGHTHVPEIRTLENGITIINPGSISLPKNQMPPTFGLLNNNTFSILHRDTKDVLFEHFLN